MLHRSLEATRLIHEKLGTIMSAVYSYDGISKLLDERMPGSNPGPLGQSLIEIPTQRAGQALLELALYLRMVDDMEGLSEDHKLTFGTLERPDGSTVPLQLRDVVNKIIHTQGLTWHSPAMGGPKVVCQAPPHQEQSHNWVRASIDLAALCALCWALQK